ncbi:DUF4209 domain-containing protein [Hymenobacter sp.]|jgi:hypothetical protein|uniref:DUF4209 domain-containing protein n=1 Tax=Hymenobacter sp. TaxID=1898978 RepID=UPI002ED95730
MDPQPITPTAFSTAADLAQFLDTNCHNWNPRTHDRALDAQLKAATFPAELAHLVQAELVALGVWFEGTTARREFEATTDQGETVGSPLPADLTPPPYDYYQQRFDQTPNLYLKARYGLLLWNAPAPYKRQDRPRASLDSLLTALSSADCTSTKAGRRDCLDIIRQLCALATEFKYQHDAVRAAVLDRYAGRVPFERQSRPALLRFIAEHGKLFRPATADILESTRSLYTEHLTAGDAYSCLLLAQLAAKIAQGGGQDVREWHHRQGQANEAQGEKRLNDDSNLVPSKFYADAARSYQLAGDEAAEQAALQKAQALKDKIRLGAHSSRLDPEQEQLLNEDIKRKTAELLALDPVDIFEWFGMAPDAIPDFAATKVNATNLKSLFTELFSVMHIDVNKNFQHGAEASEGQPHPEKLRIAYQSAITFRLYYLHSILIEGVKAGKLTFANFQDFLTQRSWVAQPIKAQDLQGNEFTYNWLPLLLPACGEFFKQLDLALAGEEQQVSFVLCLDSLVPKIEALMRELLQLTGNATVATGSKAGLHEVFFDDLLNNLEKAEMLTESEAQFFRFVFTPVSQNLRNNIAHGYYRLPGQYSFESALLVFCALLRVVSFPLTPVAPSEEANSSE